MFLYGLRDSTQCILIDISISCYQFFVVYLIVDVKINLIQCQCQCQYKGLTFTIVMLQILVIQSIFKVNLKLPRLGLIHCSLVTASSIFSRTLPPTAVLTELLQMKLQCCNTIYYKLCFIDYIIHRLRAVMMITAALLEKVEFLG